MKDSKKKLRKSLLEREKLVVIREGSGLTDHDAEDMVGSSQTYGESSALQDMSHKFNSKQQSPFMTQNNSIDYTTEEVKEELSTPNRNKI